MRGMPGARWAPEVGLRAMKSAPFPYYGEGSARPIREKDGLMVLVVFAGELTRVEADRVVSSAPAALQTVVAIGGRWVSFETSDVGVSYSPLAGALTKWIRRLHKTHPVALFFVGSDGKRGPWHKYTVAHFGELVRPVIDLLRRSGAVDHADWIARSFL